MDQAFSISGAIRQQQPSIRNLGPQNLYQVSPNSNIIRSNIPFNKTSSIGTTRAPGYFSPSPRVLVNSTTASNNYYSRGPPFPVQQSQTSFSAPPTLGLNPFRSSGIGIKRGTGTYPTLPSYSSANNCNSPNSGSSFSNLKKSPSNHSTFPTENYRKQNQEQVVSKTQPPHLHPPRMPNNQNHISMHKQRYASVHDNVQPQGNSNCVASECKNEKVADVKSLIQQINPQSPKKTANNNTNNLTSNASIQSPPHPQYRIFKRGDSIPGIASPIQITNENITKPSNSATSNATKGKTPVHSADNNSNETADTGNTHPNNNHKEEETITPNALDKENSNGGELNANNSAIGPKTPLSQVGDIARFHTLTVEYRLVKESGPPHAPTFTVLLRLGTEEYTGQGSSIKKAQHAAAVEALENSPLQKPPLRAKPKKPFAPTTNKRPNWAILQLTALSQELQVPLQFVQQPVTITDPFRRNATSAVSVHVGDKIFTGEGSNFNTAKNMAVMLALKTMLKVKQELELAKITQPGAEEQSLDAENKSPISVVHEMSMKRGLGVSFEIVDEVGPPHMKVFTVKCKVGDELESDGQGPTKQAAKKASSEVMIAKLKEIPITLPSTPPTINIKAMQRGLLRQKSGKKKTSTPVVKDLDKQTVSPISRLIQIAHIKKYKEPEFTLISTGTESNVENFLKQITERDRRMLRKKKPVFTIEVTVGPYTCSGAGSNKKAAKKAAAEAAIVALGYEPTEGVTLENSETPSIVCESAPIGQPSATTTVKPSQPKKTNNIQTEIKVNSSTVKLAGARQIAPGIIVLKTESTDASGTSATAVAQEIKKGNTIAPSTSSREGIEKLAYLTRLLEISVSYSDFPKKNEYLSVVSLTTNPPHVAHGCGATLEEAQNAAALKILEDLSTMDLDTVTAAAEKPTE